MDQRKTISIWLLLCSFMVMSMIMLGGYTRLSEAGLSIVEWKPLTGIFPPANEKEWSEEFNLYSQFPEFKEKNFDITISQFKKIYWTEYLHRLLGRITGIVFFLPFIFFLYQKWLKKGEIFTLLFIFCLGGIQGFIGWYMVRSGLKFDPDVSHYRLTLHMLVAVFIYGLIIWNAMIFYRSRVKKYHYCNATMVVAVTAILCVLQITLGAMVAGLNAGLIYNTFPLMGGSFIPNDFNISTNIDAVLSNPTNIQFFHRIIGVIFLGFCIFLLIHFEISVKTKKIIKVSVRMLCVLTFAQIVLGILTLIYQVPFNLALLHQLIAIIIFTNLLFIIHHLVYNSNTTVRY
ncbi:MAG: COX15/CtaA family protein [Alphaproteobacteria bacterium]|nr:COX15/CtaA family protein [Alphaproteobacteria bacterium]